MSKSKAQMSMKWRWSTDRFLPNSMDLSVNRTETLTELRQLIAHINELRRVNALRIELGKDQ